MERYLRLVRAVGGLMCISVFLGLTILMSMGEADFPPTMRATLLGMIYTLLGIDVLIEAVLKIIAPIEISLGGKNKDGKR